MVASAKRAKIEKLEVLSQNSVEKNIDKLDFQRKLRAYQKQGKKGRLSVAKFAKKHGFSSSAVRNGLKGLSKRTRRLQQRVEATEIASKMARVNGSQIRRSMKSPALSLRSINRAVLPARMLGKLKKSLYWSELKAEFDEKWGELDMGDSDWKAFFNEYDWICRESAAGGHIARDKLCFFKNVRWVNVLFGRKP